MVESSCSVSWLFLKLAVKNHLLQTQLSPALETHAAHNLVLLLLPYSVFWDTAAFPQRMPKEPQATKVLCSAFQEHMMRIYMCSAGNCKANRPFTQLSCVPGNNILSFSRCYGNRLAARIQLHFTNAQQKLEGKKCCVPGLLS